MNGYAEQANKPDRVNVCGANAKAHRGPAGYRGRYASHEQMTIKQRFSH